MASYKLWQLSSSESVSRFQEYIVFAFGFKRYHLGKSAHTGSRTMNHSVVSRIIFYAPPSGILRITSQPASQLFAVDSFDGLYEQHIAYQHGEQEWEIDQWQRREA